jgi:hypothetical protein
MAYYFVGQEDHEFTKNGSTPVVDTATTAQRRTANARCSLKVGGTSGLASITESWQCPFSSAINLFWFSAQWGWVWAAGTNNFSAGDFIAFLDGATRRLILTTDFNNVGGGSSRFWRLSKRTAANSTTVLQTSTTAIPPNTLGTSATAPIKVDVFVSYGTSGQVIVYVGGTMVINYSGDVTTDSATTLNAAALGCLNISTGSSTPVTSYWSEVVCRTTDTRSVSVNVLYPAANGNAWAWSNDYTKVNETITDDTGIATSATAGQDAEVTVNSSSISGTPGVRAVIVSARAQKGGTGPQNCKLMVRTSSTDYLGSSQALPAAYGLVQDIWEVNPNTSAAWLYSDLTAGGFNVGIESET